jgi:hypothetical protein
MSDMPQFTEEDRESFRAAARAVNDAQLSVPSIARSYRNALTIAILVLAAAAIVFPILATRADSRLLNLHPLPAPSATPSSTVASTVQPTPTPRSTGPSSAPPSTPAVSRTPPPTTQAAPAAGLVGSGTKPASTTDSPSGPAGMGEIASIELWGVLGGLVGAMAGLRNLRGSTQPVGLQLAQIALKIPAGALTALVGVILLQAALTPNTLAVKDGSIAAFAILFGAAQEGITGFVDRAAGNLLDKGKTLGEKTTQAA